mmetsp:Transcript_68178/g.134651  ORF Transcript_68178/g.134651 Transcript_68178/m.134651 type:complete len:397 (+) Transcript_68178:52-1242(+)
MSTMAGGGKQHQDARFAHFQLFSESMGTDWDRLSQSLPTQGGCWELPSPPLHFPLRDALLSGQETLSHLTSCSPEAAAATVKVPLIARHTEKSRALKAVGRRRRRGLDWTGEEPLQQTPRAPPECSRPKTPPRNLRAHVLRGGAVQMLPSMHNSHLTALRSAEEAGRSLWPVMNGSRSMPNLAASAGTSPEDDIKQTWTSAARAVLSHTRRFCDDSLCNGQKIEETHGSLGKHLQCAQSSWHGPSSQSCRHLPTLVKDWATAGLEFSDKGLGIGERFEPEIRMRAARSPGAIYEQLGVGSVTRWASNSTMPTKQLCTQHHSAVAHKMGVRHDAQGKGESSGPGPGTYESRGFVADLLQKSVPRRPKGDDNESHAAAHASCSSLFTEAGVARLQVMS